MASRRLDLSLPVSEGNRRSRADPSTDTIAGELQRRLDAADAELDPGLKKDHEVVSRELIKERYPDEWVALFPTHVDASGRLIAGRLLGHTPDRECLAAMLKPFKEANPNLPVFTYFTGRYPFGKNIVRV